MRGLSLYIHFVSELLGLLVLGGAATVTLIAKFMSRDYLPG